MDLDPYAERLRDELAVAAEAAGPEARVLAERLMPPLDASIRLMLLLALSAASDEITRELAPGSVEVRLRGGDPEFVVTLPPSDDADEPEPAPALPDADEAATARINLRLPEHLKAGVEQAAGREQLSVNAGLVRVVAAAVAQGDRPRPRTARRGQPSYTGWVR
jgi:hypothetical protein